jgi:methanogenic corrinoid protein MtbC1
MDTLVKALLDGDQAGALAETRNLRDGGVELEQIVTEGVEKAMARLDAKCTVEQFNLLEIMLSGRAVMGVINELYPPMTFSPRTKGAVVVGTLEGDVHDLGKNVLKSVLTASGYRVVDCGKDCPAVKMIDAASGKQPWPS